MLDELRSGLELATEEELQQLTKILFARGINPLDYWKNPLPEEIENQDWHIWLDTIEKRFRYLAADGITVLKGGSQKLSYRQILIKVCKYLKVNYSQTMSTTDIEAEIFLELINKTWHRLPPSTQNTLNQQLQQSIRENNLDAKIARPNYQEAVQLLLKGSGIWAINSVVKKWLLKEIARQFSIYFASYQGAKIALAKGGIAAVTKLQHHLILNSAKQGMAMTTASYAVTRSVFAVVGPILWTSLIAELGWKAIATNYNRIIPVIFAIAQIRLTRSEVWEIA